MARNDHLKGENRTLKRRVEQLQKKLSQQLKTSKPFIDLTADDKEGDSDLEINETENPTKKPRMNSPESVSVIALDEPEPVDEPEIVEPEPALNPAPEVTRMDSDDMQNRGTSELDLQSGLWLCLGIFDFLSRANAN